MKMSMFKWLRRSRRALMLFELLLAFFILGTLFSIGIPLYINQLEKARVVKAITDIHVFQVSIFEYLMNQETLPETLADIGRDKYLDPWGSPYQYLKIEGKPRKEVMKTWRKDRFMVPLNSDFDLYSMGKDRKSSPPLTAKQSRDDVVRANNGSYLGLASKF